MSESADPVSFDPAQLEELLHDVPLEVTIELGRIRLNLGELASRLGPGAPLDVRVNNRLVARAEAIAVGERCGIRIVELAGGKES
jgi:flagellar motor switch protein FliN/FliY